MVESGAPIIVWGINNEYETLRDVLLGIPQFYRWVDAGPLTKRTLLNAEQLGAKFDLQLAMAQHAEMVRAYESAGVTCHFLDSDEVLHRHFFARDSSAMTPWGALICHMQLKCRRADYVTAIRFYQNANIPIWNMVSAGHFEGGDFCIIQPGSVLIGFGGERSEEEGARQVAAWVEAEGWEAVVAPIPTHFVHIDALVVPIAPKLAVACLDALESWVIDWLSAKGFEFIDVSYGECAKNLGVNLVSLGNKRILSMAGSANLNARLEAMGFEVIAPDMSMFTLGGGSVHCLSQALVRDSA
ncbi:MAG: arginine deiminase family protein [Gammaproteobacteria bacterium]|nr:arginine deiminase family protein [Gammaproteobacteria bacterium]MDH3465351.1 arginine deiminase family protein [Gammaproteobacteria bacterium]